MAVIITNMDMPKHCFTVENTRFKYCKLYGICEYKDIRYGFIPNDCPLKSTDEMIAEIEEKSFVDYDETYTDNGKCLVTEDDVLEIINKYCKGAEKWEWR